MSFVFRVIVFTGHFFSHKWHLIHFSLLKLILDFGIRFIKNSRAGIAEVFGLIKFLFSNGGKEFYYAYVYESKLYNGFLFMVLGKAYLSNEIKPIIDNIKEQQKAKELNLSVQGIAKLNLEEIEL